MYMLIRERVLTRARKFLEVENATIRSIARLLNVPKSTLHRDLSIRLKEMDYKLYLEVQKKLDYNKSVRHIRGGMAIKLKYAH